jgi:phage-related protein
MADWFDFAGVRSTSRGVYVQEYPPLTLPEERAKFEPVPGRSGNLTLLEGDAVYDDIALSVDCFMRDLSKLDQISAWLRGRGALVLGNMPDRYYDARCVNQIELSKILRGREHRTFAAVFRCKPFRYVYPAPASTVLVNGGSLVNPGNVDAEPVITLTGSGDVTLTIGDKSVDIALPSTATTIIIDVPAGFAYSADGTVNMTGLLSIDDWPLTIPPGTSAVAWTGTVSSASILRNWRYV